MLLSMMFVIVLILFLVSVVAHWSSYYFHYFNMSAAFISISRDIAETWIALSNILFGLRHWVTSFINPIFNYLTCLLHIQKAKISTKVYIIFFTAHIFLQILLCKRFQYAAAMYGCNVPIVFTYINNRVLCYL